MYLTYAEYTNMGGELIGETAFANLEFEARSIIDYWTFNRLQNETSYPEAVQRCMFALIKLIQLKQNAMDPSISAETGVSGAGIVKQANDDVVTEYSVISARSAIDMANQDIQATVRQYLQAVRNSLGQKVLYRGVYPNE